MFFNPDPYVKIFVQPSNSNNNNSINGTYNQEYKTKVVTNTCFPSWKDEVI